MPVLTAEELKALTVEQLAQACLDITTEQGIDAVAEFKTLAAGRKAYKELTKVEAVKEVKPAADLEALGRGSVQGVGAFAREQLLAGLDNKVVLAAVKEQFPSAKTSGACIAYYRTKLISEGLLVATRKAAAPANEPEAEVEATA